MPAENITWRKKKHHQIKNKSLYLLRCCVTHAQHTRRPTIADTLVADVCWDSIRTPLWLVLWKHKNYQGDAVLFFFSFFLYFNSKLFFNGEKFAENYSRWRVLYRIASGSFSGLPKKTKQIFIIPCDQDKKKKKQKCLEKNFHWRNSGGPSGLVYVCVCVLHKNKRQSWIFTYSNVIFPALWNGWWFPRG